MKGRGGLTTTDPEAANLPSRYISIAPVSESFVSERKRAISSVDSSSRRQSPRSPRFPPRAPWPKVNTGVAAKGKSGGPFLPAALSAFHCYGDRLVEFDRSP